jgi:paraquat-inducible protein B
MPIRPAIVGAFVLGALALAAAAVILFGGSRLFATTSRAVIFFEGSVAGLDVGAPVTFRGVRLGAVIRVALNFDPATRAATIPVTIEIEPDRITWEGARPGRADYGRLVAAGLRAQLASQSLVTGQLRVDLDFRPDTPMRMVGGETDLPEIPAIPSDLDQLRSKLTELPLRDLVDAAQRALVSVDRLATHLDAEIATVADATTAAAGAAAKTLNTADDSLVQVREAAKTSLRNADALVGEARRQLDGRGGELSRALADIDRSLHSLDTLLASANSLLAPRSSFRGDLEAAMRDLSATAGSLRTFARTVERDPSAVLTGRTGR